MNLKRLSKFAALLMSLLLFGISLWAISHELQEYNSQDLIRSLKETTHRGLLLGLLITLLNYLTITGYDTLAVRYIGHPLPYYRTALAAVISIAISNSIGLALLTGSAVRYRLYPAWGLSVIDIAHIIAFCNLSFWLGLFTVAGVVFVAQPLAVPSLLHLPFTSVHPIGIVFLVVVLGYLLWNIFSRRSLKIGKWVFPHLSTPLAFGQIVVASLDWALAAGILYALLPSSTPISYLSFLSVFLLGQLAGVISNVPGGLGVFETIILLLLSPSIPSATLFGVLLVYRVIYYLIPLIIAVLLLGTYELRQRAIAK
jgi:hypothetical protein